MMYCRLHRKDSGNGNQEEAKGEETADSSVSVLRAGFHSREYDYRDIIMDILFFFITVGAAFGWMMLMLLIISFVTLSYLHFHIVRMIIVSSVFAAGAAAIYIWKKVKKYRLLRERESRSSSDAG